jgi:hypothetical protein
MSSAGLLQRRSRGHVDLLGVSWPPAREQALGERRVRLFWSEAESPELRAIRGQRARLPRVLTGLELRASPDPA